MPIDDPLDVARQSTEPSQIGKNQFSDAVLLIASNLIPGVSLFKDYVQKDRDDKQLLFMQTLINEIAKLREKFNALDEKHQNFLRSDFSALVLDGLKKAEQTRAKERVVRIAQIVAKAAKKGSTCVSDEVEEMMRIAMDITDVEVEFLRQMTLMPSSNHPGGIATADEANDDWKEHYPKISGINLSQYSSVSLKLQTFGLMQAVERNPMKLGPNVTPFRVLKKELSSLNLLQTLRQVQRHVLEFACHCLPCLPLFDQFWPGLSGASD